MQFRINGIASRMTLKSSEVKSLVLMDQYNIEIFSCYLRLLPFTLPHFHQTNVESAQICPKDNPLISRILSHHLLLEVILRAEEECLFFLPLGKLLGKLDRIELLVQYQSMFFQEWEESLKMSK